MHKWWKINEKSVPKSMLNRWNISAKSILEKVMQKTWKNSENGSQKGSNICENVIKKRGPKIIWFWKVILAAGRLFSHAAFGGGGLPNLKGGDCLGKHPRSDGRFLEDLEYLAFEWLFDVSQIQQKSATIQNWSEGDTKGSKSAKMVRWVQAWGRFTGP